MADLRYKVEVDTRAAEQALAGLQNTLAGFGSAIASAFAFGEITRVAAKFQDLRTSLQILYKDAQTGSAVFDDLKKMALESSYSVEELTQTVVKLKAAGLTPTISLLKLFGDVASVNADRLGTLQAITDLYARTTGGGLGLEELNRLADRGIPVFKILGDSLGVSRDQLSELGKTAEGAKLILSALEQGLQQLYGGAAGARANNLSTAFSQFKDALANAADTIGQSGLNQGLSDLVKSVTELISRNQELMKSFGEALGSALKFTADNVDILLKSVVALLTYFTVTRIVALATAFIALGKAIVATPLGRIAALAALAVGAFVDLDGGMKEASATLDGLKDTEGFKVLEQGTLAQGTENFRQRALDLNQALQKFKAELANVSVEFQRYNDNVIRTMELETMLIGTSKLYQDTERAKQELYKRSADEIAKLTAQKAKLTQEELNQGRGAAIDAEIKKIEEITAADIKRTEAAVKNANARQNARKLEEFVTQTQIDLENELIRINDEMAKTGLSSIEQKYYDIEAAARKSAKAQIDAETIRRGAPLSAEEIKAYYDAAAAGSERVKAATKDSYEQSRLFSTGWKKALSDYVDNANNAAKTAERLFSKLTSGMEDMIVNFAKTGKFEWKGFVQSMLEELLRSQIQQLFGSMLGGIMDLFGVKGQGAQGRGASANNPIFVAPVTGGLGGAIGGAGGSAAGGGGGGLGDMLGGLWDSVTGIFSGGGNSGGGGDSGGGLWDTVTGAVSSLFDGWFANGGQIGAGKFGVVGEAGPELVSGPANVTPMNMGGSVTYNINAVDAASFKALVAADPGFIHAVAMQGAKSVPSRR